MIYPEEFIRLREGVCSLPLLLRCGNEKFLQKLDFAFPGIGMNTQQQVV
jgi:hypothetical protein